MSHYNVNYSELSRKEADAKAIKDTREYLGTKAWEVLLHEMGRAEGYGMASPDNCAKVWRDISYAISFCGVNGYPVHALGRAYMPTIYRHWMESGPEKIKLDKEGFPL